MHSFSLYSQLDIHACLPLLINLNIRSVLMDTSDLNSLLILNNKWNVNPSILHNLVVNFCSLHTSYINNFFRLNQIFY